MNVRHVLAAAVATAALSALAVPAAHAADAPAKLPSCDDVSTGDGGYEQKLIKTSISDIVGPVVGGSGWQAFKGTVTSTAATDLKGVTWNVILGRQTENGEDQPGPYLDVEYKSRATGQWVALPGNGGELEVPGTLKPHQTVTQELRLRVDADVPAVINFVDAYVYGAVDDIYTNPVSGVKTPCRGSAGAQDFFVVKPAGSTVPTGKPTTAPPKPTATATTSRPGKPGEGKPTGQPTEQPSGKPGATATVAPSSAAPSPSGSPTTQLGGVTDTGTGEGAGAATGNLASTGSSSALPIVGLVGGAAVLVGVAAMVVVRRKRRV
jgi:LPXTG-motif cell wall-anchored protein